MQPTASLLACDTVDSNDSGYASTQPDGTDATLSPSSSVPPNDSIVETRTESADTTRRHSTAASEVGLQIHTWHLNDDPFDTSEPGLLSAANLPSASDASPRNPTFSADGVLSPIDWSHIQDDWWSKKPDEGSATTVGRPLLPSRTSTIVPNANSTHDVTRRQTVAFPLPTNTEPQYDYLQNQPGVFDDLALLLANRTPGAGTGLTPHLTEFSCWWDIANLDFAQAHANLHPETQPQQAFNVTSMPPDQQLPAQLQPMPQQDTPQDYFNLWPG